MEPAQCWMPPAVGHRMLVRRAAQAGVMALFLIFRPLRLQEMKMNLDLSPSSCVLNKTDSTSAMGWLRKSNHDPGDTPIHNNITGFHASNTMERNACNYSQHLPGVLNVVADSLSRDFHLSDNQLV